MAARPQYGPAHRARRQQALAALAPGAPCPNCKLPMFATPAQAAAAGLPPAFGRLHLDHVLPVALGGAHGPTWLVHGRCNEASGGYLGAVISNDARGHPVGSSARRRRKRTPGPAGAPARPTVYDRW